MHCCALTLAGAVWSASETTVTLLIVTADDTAALTAFVAA